jgi:hypothetical protein
LVKACEEINQAMDLGQEPAKKLYERWSFILKRNLQSVLANGLVYIMKQDVVAPQVNIWVGGALKEGLTWFAEKVMEFWRSSNPETEPGSENAAENEQSEERPEEPEQPKKKPERKRPKEEEAQETRTGGKPKPKGNKPKDKPAAANDNAANDNTYGPQPCRDDTCNAGGYNNGESSANAGDGRALAEAAFREKAKNLLRDNVPDPEERAKYEQELYSVPLEELGKAFADINAEQNQNAFQKFWNKLPKIRFVADANANPLAYAAAREILKKIIRDAPLLFASLWGAQKAATQQQKEFDYRRNNDRQEEELRRNFRAQAGGSYPMPDPDDNDWEPGGEKHQRWKQQYETKNSEEIKRGIRSFDKQINLHEDKINNPEKYVSDFSSRNEHYRQGLLKKWHKEIETYKEQKAILEKIMEQRLNGK